MYAMRNTRHNSAHVFGLIRSLVVIYLFGIHTAQLKPSVHISENEFPGPLPRSTSGPFMKTPYRSLYQGKRLSNDTRIFNERFQYNATMSGNILHIEQVFDCILTHIVLETTNNIPVILRGGVGYRHLSAVVRAEPGDELSARVRAFCVKPANNI